MQLGHVRNPLTVIAIFSGVAETSAAAVLPFVEQDFQGPLVWFVISFPILLLALFFATMNWNHRVLYAPSDYRADRSFLSTIRSIDPGEREARLRDELLTQGDAAMSAQTLERAAASYLEVEDLVLRKISHELHLELKRGVRLGRRGFAFDGVAIGPDSVTIIEVKNFKTARFSAASVQQPIFLASETAKELEGVPVLRFVLAVVVDADDAEFSVVVRRVYELVEDAQNQWPSMANRIIVRIFRLHDLPGLVGTRSDQGRA